MRSTMRCVFLLALSGLGGVLAGCPSEYRGGPDIRINGAVVDEVGNLVWPTLVTMTLANGELVECGTAMGRFSCNSGPWGVDTLRVERGADVYTEQIGLAIEDCQGGCLLERPFVVAVGPEGACNADTLPLVARLTSVTPLEFGMISTLHVLAPEGLNVVVHPADQAEPEAGSETRARRELLLYVAANLGPKTTLSLELSWQQNGALCGEQVYGPEPSLGTIQVELPLRPGPVPCGYLPVTISVGPEDLIECR